MRLHPQLLRYVPAIVGVALAGLVLILNSGGGEAAEENGAAVVVVTPNPTPTQVPLPFLYFYPTAFFQDESAAATVILFRGGYPYYGPIYVTFSTSDGTAVGGASCGPGIDYIQVVNAQVGAGEGQLYASTNITLCADGISESPETINLSITGSSSGEPRTAVLTISDEPLRFSISGRVRTAGGRGIWNAHVHELDGHDAYTRGSFGWYTLTDLIPGRSYSVNVISAPHHHFTNYQRYIPLLVGDLTDVGFTADP